MNSGKILNFLLFLGLLSCNDTKQQQKVPKTLIDVPSTILRVISTTPSYTATPQQEQQAKIFLKQIYPNNKVESFVKDTIEFVDQGQNFDSIICTFCKKEINTEFWQDAMEAAEKNNFTDLTIRTPCCQKKSSLNDLKYVEPAGFAKFILSVDDPQALLNETEISTLQNLLNTRLRIIIAHY